MKNFDQARSEIKQLPFMIGKMLGGSVTVIGVTLAVLLVTRNPDYLLKELFIYLLTSGGGIFIFLLSSKLLGKRLAKGNGQIPDPGTKIRSNVLSWGLLLLFAAIFLLITYFSTKIYQ